MRAQRRKPLERRLRSGNPWLASSARLIVSRPTRRFSSLETDAAPNIPLCHDFARPGPLRSSGYLGLSRGRRSAGRESGIGESVDGDNGGRAGRPKERRREAAGGGGGMRVGGIISHPRAIARAISRGGRVRSRHIYLCLAACSPRRVAHR